MSTAAIAHAGIPLLGAKTKIFATEIAKHRALYPIAQAIATSQSAPSIEANESGDLASCVFYAWLHARHPGEVLGCTAVEVEIQDEVEYVTYAGMDCIGDSFTFPSGYHTVTRAHPLLLASLFEEVESAGSELLLNIVTPLAGARAYVNTYFNGDRNEFYYELAQSAEEEHKSLQRYLRDAFGRDLNAPWNITRTLGAHVVRSTYEGYLSASRRWSLNDCELAIARLRPKKMRSICARILACTKTLKTIAKRSQRARRLFYRADRSVYDPNTFSAPIGFLSDPDERTLEFVADEATQSMESGGTPSYLDIRAGHLASATMIDATSAVLSAQRAAIDAIASTISDLHALNSEDKCTN